MTQDRINQILDRIKWMDENLSGCDWCCGGGDEELASLSKEFLELTGKTPNEYRVEQEREKWLSKGDYRSGYWSEITNEQFYFLYAMEYAKNTKGLVIVGGGTDNPKVKVVF